MSDEKKTEEVVEETTEEVTEAPAEVKEEVEVSKEAAAIIESVEKMTVLELNQLVKAIEAKWDVSATAAAAPAAGGDAGAGEKSEFDVVLVSDGGAKIPTMKVVKDLLGLGLKDAKELVESVPATLKEGVKAEEAEEMKAKLEEAGAKVELK